MSDQPTATARAVRLADLHARLDAGEFAAVFSLDSEPTGEQAAMQRRAQFGLYAAAAAVDHDPGSDFDGFVEDLWVMVSSDFRLLPDNEDDGGTGRCEGR